MTVELHMLPVPAGDATLILDRSKHRTYSVLIDAGLATDEVVSYLQSVGVFHLDLIILSHPDLDHLKGLLAIFDNPLISVGQVWCFDLGFLREFVTTGIIPRPQKPTHQIYYSLFLKTLDGMDHILKTLGKKNVLALQVSAGHRLTLGSLYLEVLYPWDGFYDGLHSPVRIKEMLVKKRWPHDWIPPEWARDNLENERPALAKKISDLQERQMLGRLLDRLDSENEEYPSRPLTMIEDDQEDEAVQVSEENGPSRNGDTLPISTIGTLYNNLSIVTKIHVLGGINPPTMLFPGDLTDWTYLLARRLPDLSADLLKYPHHGSAGPGVSPRFLKEWEYHFRGHCPCGPWCHPACNELNYKYWRHLERKIFQRDALGLFSEVVRPSHILVYPYPSQGLPKGAMFSGYRGTLHVNRDRTDMKSLSSTSNPAVPRVLIIGKEKDEIRSR